MRASISSVVKVFSLAGLFWVDESSDMFENGIATDSTDDKSSVKELEIFCAEIKESKDADDKPGA